MCDPSKNMQMYRVYIVHSVFQVLQQRSVGDWFEILVVIIIEIWTQIVEQYYTVVMQPPSSMEQLQLN